MEYQIEKVKTYIGSRRTTNSNEANAWSAWHIVEAKIYTCRCGYSFISFSFNIYFRSSYRRISFIPLSFSSSRITYFKIMWAFIVNNLLESQYALK